MRNMSLDADITAYFFNNSGICDSKTFIEALNLLRCHLKDDRVREINELEAIELIRLGGLTKRHVFVFERFEGNIFKKLQLTKALLLGSPCILECLTKKQPIPSTSGPVFATTMRNLQISITGLSTDEKDRIRCLVQWMGGMYFKNFGRSITHLVSTTVRSNKYQHARLNEVPIIHPDWIFKLWALATTNYSAAVHINPNDYRLPIFFGINATCTGLSVETKHNVIRVLTENGGCYHAAFRSHIIDVLIAAPNLRNSDKYKAAVRFKKDILHAAWVFDSVKEGSALPFAKYIVIPRKQISTPTKSVCSTTDQTELSDISRISFLSVAKNMGTDLASVDETIPTSITKAELSNLGDNCETLLPPTSAASPKRNLEIIDISLCLAKNSGILMDGCCVYLLGFTPHEREKLNRLLNTAGAVRCEKPVEGVTHVIIDQYDAEAYFDWKAGSNVPSSVHFVHLGWLLDSIKVGKQLEERKYTVELRSKCKNNKQPALASPRSIAALSSIRSSFDAEHSPPKQFIFEKTAASVKVMETSKFETDDRTITQSKVLGKYSKAENGLLQSPKPLASSTQLNIKRSNQLQENIDQHNRTQLKLTYFQDASVYIYEKHFPGEYYLQMISECEAAQANVVPQTFRDPVDYAIVSFEHTLNKDDLPVKAYNIITELYVECCMKSNKLLPISYYHTFVPHTAAARPLKGMVIVVSTYSGIERDFIDSLSQLLGATVNKTYVKKEQPLLICSSPGGSKYEGAMKWGFPVVVSSWLLKCAETGTKYPYSDFLVGDCKVNFEEALQEHDNIPLKAPTRKYIQTVQNFSPSNVTIKGAVIRDIGSQRLSGISSENSPTDDLSSMQTISPDTPITNYTRGTYNFDFMEGILAKFNNEEERYCVQEIINDMRKNQTPELERIKRQACTPIRGLKIPPSGLPDFCLTPECQKRIADNFNKRWYLPVGKVKPDTPIDEINRRVMRITCDTLGIAYDVGNRDSTVALKKSTENFNPSQKRFEEFKENSNGPPKNLTFAQDAEELSRKLLDTNTINLDINSFEDTKDVQVSDVMERQCSKARTSPEIRLIAKYLQVNESRRSNLIIPSSDESSIPAPMSLTQNFPAKTTHVQPFDSEQIISNTQELVGWGNPNTLSSTQGTKKISEMQYRGIPCFSLSGCEHQRGEIKQLILKLGGEVCENLTGFDPLCTHFLCEKPNRGEKTLGSISAGKWILSVKYIEECHSNGAFIDEELFEWGNGKAIHMPDLTDDERQIAQAAYKWRVKLQSSGEIGAFSGFVIILHISERRMGAIKSVINAGKGKILNVEPPFSLRNEANMATHCFVDQKKTPLTSLDYTFLKCKGVNILSHLYINAYLMNGPDVDIGKYVIKT